MPEVQEVQLDEISNQLMTEYVQRLQERRADLSRKDWDAEPPVSIDPVRTVVMRSASSYP